MFKKLFNKSDGLAELVERRFGGGGNNTRFSAIQEVFSKVKYHIDAWKDTRKKKKKNKEPKVSQNPLKDKPKVTVAVPVPEVSKKPLTSAPVSDREDFPPIDQTVQTTKSRIARIADWLPTEVTFSKKKIRKWNTKQTVGAVAVAGALFTAVAGITTVVTIQVRRIIRENDLTEKLKEEAQKQHRQEIESYVNILTPDPESLEKTQDAATGRLTCLEAEIAEYAKDRLPNIVIGTNGGGYLESRYIWDFNEKLPIDQKLMFALQSIDNLRTKSGSSVKSKLSQQEFDALAGKWFDESVLDWYSIELRSEAEKIIKKNESLAPEKQSTGYINYLKRAMISLELIDNYDKKLRETYHERAEKYVTRDIAWYESARKELAKIFNKDEEYKADMNEYEQRKEHGVKAIKPHSKVTYDDRDYREKYQRRIDKIDEEIFQLTQKLAIEDMKNDRGQLNNAIREKNRRVRVLKWLIEVGSHTHLEKINGAISYIFPKGVFPEDDKKPEEGPTDSADPEKSAR